MLKFERKLRRKQIGCCKLDINQQHLHVGNDEDLFFIAFIFSLPWTSANGHLHFFTALNM